MENKLFSPLCMAPFTSFKIDTNKGVRPCCAWVGANKDFKRTAEIEMITFGAAPNNRLDENYTER